MKINLFIPDDELEILTSRSGGPGGQHVNTSSTRVTIRWNVHTSKSLTDDQKELVLQKLHNQLTKNGELVVHASQSRSQFENKKLAYVNLLKIIQKALHVPKKRLPTRVPQLAKESRLKVKKQRSLVKKLRSSYYQD